MLSKTSLGIHVDYDQSLGRQHAAYMEQISNAENAVEIPEVREHQIDSLIEKCSSAISVIHRPIFKTNSAETAKITSQFGTEDLPVGGEMDINTYRYIHEQYQSEEPQQIVGKVSSYNSNTFKGRIYVAAEGRPVIFELTGRCREQNAVNLITASLSVNAINDHDSEWSLVYCMVFRTTSRNGHLKSYTVIDISHKPFE